MDKKELEYDWTQDWHLLTVIVPNINKKGLIVEIKYNRLKVKYDGKELSGELSLSIYPNESTWYMDAGSLVIELSKVDIEVWSKNVFKGEPIKDIPYALKKYHQLHPDVQKQLSINRSKPEYGKR